MNRKTIRKKTAISCLCMALLIMGCREKNIAAETQKVATGDVNAVKQPIAAGSNLNSKDPIGGLGPLLTACPYEQNEIAVLRLDIILP